MNKTKRISISLGVVAVLSVLGTSPAIAGPIYCEAEQNVKNYMAVDDSVVSACLGSGLGNVNGNPAHDEFLMSAAGAGFSLASKSDEPGNNPFNLIYDLEGLSWKFDESFWDHNTEGAIAFKFGTGNNPDSWFVFSLVPGQSFGNFQFFNILGNGGGLSHMNLYGNAVSVPEPGTLALLGLGLVGMAAVRRRRKS